MSRFRHCGRPGVIVRAGAFLEGFTPEYDYTLLSLAPRPVSNRVVPVLPICAPDFRNLYCAFGELLEKWDRGNIDVFVPTRTSVTLRRRQSRGKIGLCKNSLSRQ